MECLVPHTWLYFPCPELQHKGLLGALFDLVCESLVKKESAGVCGLLKCLLPQGFCAVPQPHSAFASVFTLAVELLLLASSCIHSR